MAGVLGVAVLLVCWIGGVILAASGRHHAARVFAGEGTPRRAVLEAQMVGTALNRVLPAGAGLVATHMRLLRRRGYDRQSVVAALAGYAAGGALAYALLFVVVLAAAVSGAVQLPSHARLPSVSWPLVLTAGLLLALVLAGLRRRGVRSLTGARMISAHAVRAVFSEPAAVGRLTLIQAASQLLMGVGLFAALLATGTKVSLLALLVVYLVSSSLAAAVPAPGGTGPVEVGLLAGLALLGVPMAAGGPAVALFRAVTHWLPVPIGIAVAVVALRRHRRVVQTLPPSFAVRRTAAGMA